MFDETENDLKENLRHERHENKENRKELRMSHARNMAKNVVIAILLITTIFGAYQYNRASTLRRKLDNAYNRAFFELVDYVQNVEIMLMKARMTSSPELTAATLNDVWREATAATSSLNQLPISMGVLTNTEKFLSQVADLSKTIARQNSYGVPIDEDQMQTLAKLHTFSLSLEDSLNDLHSDLNNGNLKWENVANEKLEDKATTNETDENGNKKDDNDENAKAVAKNTNKGNMPNQPNNTDDSENTGEQDQKNGGNGANGGGNGSEADKEMQEASESMPNTFSGINDGFEEMPTLIYDGPYSEHLENRKALGLTGQKITENQAIEKVKAFMQDKRIKKITKLADNKNGVIDTYNIKMELEEGKNKSVSEVDVSVTGGHIVWFLYNRDVGEVTIDIDKAIEIGGKFLSDRGYANMKDSYYTRNDGVATINFAYNEDGITYYTDLIKVKVALDNGEIVGFESKGYLMNHRDRSFAPAKISQVEARAKINKGDSVEESGLAVIPTNYGSEILCYEFIGKIGDRDFLIYINANTGVEEDVLIIINSDEGILTM